MDQVSNVFHEGELAVQKMTGSDLIASRVGRVIRSTIDPAAIYFIAEQPMMVVATQDENGYVWPSLILSEKGFIKVSSPNTITVDLTKIRSSKEDVLYKNLEANSAIGTLYIELATRRRFRVNGTAHIEHTSLTINVNEAYGNCPKYIQRRTVPEASTSDPKSTSITGIKLTATEKSMISNADTFFIASQSNENKLDASHRGGASGFVEILSDDTLKIPDYPGNNMYNSLGNIAQNSKMGLLFLNFETGETLQLIGEGTLLFNQQSDEDDEKTGGTGRYWEFRPQKWIRTTRHHLGNWQYIDASPFNP